MRITPTVYRFGMQSFLFPIIYLQLLLWYKYLIRSYHQYLKTLCVCMRAREIPYANLGVHLIFVRKAPALRPGCDSRQLLGSPWQVRVDVIGNLMTVMLLNCGHCWFQVFDFHDRNSFGKLNKIKPFNILPYHPILTDRLSCGQPWSRNRVLYVFSSPTASTSTLHAVVAQKYSSTECNILERNYY